MAASTGTPFSMYVFRPSLLSSTISAPIRRVEREVAASTRSETVSSA